MTKSHIVPRIGGALIALLVLLALLSCAETSKDPAEDTTEVSAGTESSTDSTESNDTSASTGSSETDAASSSADSSASSSSSSDSSAVIDDPSETVAVRVGDVNDDNGGATSRELTATNESYKGVNELYWYYTAEKKDSYFTTGQTGEETALNAGALGLPTDAFGEFSVGTWLFQFYAYEVSTESIDGADTVTIDGTTYYIGDLYYSGESYDSESYYTTLTTEQNTVSVYVKGTGETGRIIIYGVTLTESISGSLTYTVTCTQEDDEENSLTYTGDDALAIFESDSDDNEDGEIGLVIDNLAPGYYTLTVSADGDDLTIISEDGDAFLVKAGLDTTVTGTLEGLTTDAELDDDVNVTYGSVSVSTVSQLAAALADSEISTVVLTDSVTLDSYLTVTTDSTIDLNGYTITQSSSSTYGVVVASDNVTLVLTDSSEDGSGSIAVDYYPVYVVGDNADITIEGGSYTSNNYNSVYIEGDNASVTINDGTFTAKYDCITYSSQTSPDFELTINGGTFYGGQAAIDLGSNNLESATITITDGTFDGDYYSINVNGTLTSSNNVTINISGGKFTEMIYCAGYAKYNITGGTFYSSSGQAAQFRSGALTITGGSFENGYGNGSFVDLGYDYFFYTGAAGLNGDIVIDASGGGYEDISAVTISDGVTLVNEGIYYYVNPGNYSSYTFPSTLSITPSYTYLGLSELLYRRYTNYGYAYFTTSDRASSFTSMGASNYEVETSW